MATNVSEARRNMTACDTRIETSPARSPRGRSLLVATALALAACAGTDPYADVAPYRDPGSRAAPARVLSDTPVAGDPRSQGVAADPAGRPPAPDAAGGVPPEGADVPVIAGRVGFIAGGVERWDAQANGWRPAVLNETVGPRSAMRTTAGGRAEVTIGTSALRLDGDTEVSWQQLDEQHAVVDLDRGTLIVSRRSEVARPPQGTSPAPEDDAQGGPGTGLVPVTVSVASVAVVLSGPGSARLVADPATRRLTVVATSGTAEVAHEGRRTALASGRSQVFDTGSGAAKEVATVSGTEFDRWSFERDRRASGSESYRYVSPAMTGAEVLDEHGRWQVDDTYGPIWYPAAVPAGWAPYRVGHWAWVSPWGWTWVDEAPWGYAPFHYGRWAYVGNRWGWVPGGWVARPAYSPALVGFYGGGASVSITVGSPPGIGWFPLAPYEPWYPAYRYTPRYFTAVNPPSRYRQGRGPDYPYRVDQPPRYRYADSPAAATLVAAPRFGVGNPLRNRLPATADELRLLPTPGRGASLPVPPNAVLAPGRGDPRYDRYPRPGAGAPPRVAPGAGIPPAAPQRDLYPRPGSDDLDRPLYQGRPPVGGAPRQVAPPPTFTPPPTVTPRPASPPLFDPGRGQQGVPPAGVPYGLSPRPGGDDLDRPAFPSRQAAPPVRAAPPGGAIMPSQPRMAPPPMPQPQPRMSPPPSMSPPPMRAPSRPGGLPNGNPVPGSAQRDGTGAALAWVPAPDARAG